MKLHFIWDLFIFTHLFIQSVCVWEREPLDIIGEQGNWTISTARPIVFPIFHTCGWKPSQWNARWISCSSVLFVRFNVNPLNPWIKVSKNKQGVLAPYRYCAKPTMGVNWLVTTPFSIPCQWATCRQKFIRNILKFCWQLFHNCW